MMKISKVVVKRRNKYYKIPLEALYIENKESEQEMIYPIIKYKRIHGDTYEITYRIKHINVPINIDNSHVQRQLIRLGLGREDIDIILSFKDKHGLRFKSKIGVNLTVKGEVREDELFIDKKNVSITNPVTGKVLSFLNMYRREGLESNKYNRICWGKHVVSKRKYKIEDGYELFFEFMESKFNVDLDSELRNTLIKREVLNLKAETKEQVLIHRIYKSGRSNDRTDLMNLIVSSIFDLDNIEIDKNLRE